MADIIKGYKVKYAPFSATKPTEWTELTDCVRTMPNFFTDPEAVATTCIDHMQKHSVPGMTGGEAYGFKVAINKVFLEAHKTMVENQEGADKGSFWLEVEMTNRGQKVTGQFTTVKYLPTPEGEAGALDEITWNVYPVSDIELSDITPAA